MVDKYKIYYQKSFKKPSVKNIKNKIKIWLKNTNQDHLQQESMFDRRFSCFLVQYIYIYIYIYIYTYIYTRIYQSINKELTRCINLKERSLNQNTMQVAKQAKKQRHNYHKNQVSFFNNIFEYLNLQIMEHFI